MMKNDITYEYRVFTHRLIDVESMEVGICTSKVIKELKPKDKVNGRFFHTSDTDEWFFYWNNELQKLNLKGNSDVNDALAEVEQLIADAKTAVDGAKKTADEAKAAAAEASAAADAALAAVESIEGKADKSEVELKADKSVVEALSAKVDAIKLDGYATEDFVRGEIEKIDVPTKVSQLENDNGYITLNDVPNVDIPTKVSQLENDNGYITLNDVPNVDVPTKVSQLENDKKYLTKTDADGLYAALGTTGSGDGVSKEYVVTELAKKQNMIDDLDDIRSKANSALQSIPDKYVTDEELESKGYLTSHQDITGKQDVIIDLDDIRSKANSALQSIPDKYVTDEELESKGYLTSHQDITGKQDVISDLTDIRSGAAKGATALQEIPAEYITEEKLSKKGYLTEHQSLDNYYTKGQIDSMIGVAIDITNTILNA